MMSGVTRRAGDADDVEEGDARGMRLGRQHHRRQVKNTGQAETQQMLASTSPAS